MSSENVLNKMSKWSDSFKWISSDESSQWTDSFDMLGIEYQLYYSIKYCICLLFSFLNSTWTRNEELLDLTTFATVFAVLCFTHLGKSRRASGYSMHTDYLHTVQSMHTAWNIVSHNALHSPSCISINRVGWYIFIYLLVCLFIHLICR